MAYEIRNDCVGCTALGLPCKHCYMGRDYGVLICDHCGAEVEELYVVDNDDEELCDDCAREKALRYIEDSNLRTEELCDVAEISYDIVDVEDKLNGCQDYKE